MRSQAPGHGKISTLCALGCLAMAGFRRDAFSGGNPWQFFRSMHPRRGPGREKRPSLARFARHASKTSWLWQDMRAVYPKSPANRLSGIHRAKISPGRGPFRCTDPSNHARRANLAIRRRRTALALATSAPPNGAKPPATATPKRNSKANGMDWLHYVERFCENRESEEGLGRAENADVLAKTNPKEKN